MSAAIWFLTGSYLLLCSFGLLLQEKLIFLPEPKISATPQCINLDYDDVWLLTADRVWINGWYLPSPQSDKQPTILYLHGNAGNMSHCLDVVAAIHRLGLACLMIDYRGYGRSQGSPSEQGMYSDAATAWMWLRHRKGLRADQIVIWGFSLGGPVAAKLAESTNPGGLILDSTFTSLKELGHRLFPTMPVSLIMRLNYSTSESLQNVRCPVLIVHSRKDNIVPFSFASELYATAGQPKRFLETDGEHNRGFQTAKRRYIRGIGKFLKEFGLMDTRPGTDRLRAKSSSSP